MDSDFFQFINHEFKFEDDRSIKIIDVKIRDRDVVEYWVVYEIKFSLHGIPKRLAMPEREFISSFGHLFFEKQ